MKNPYGKLSKTLALVVSTMALASGAFAATVTLTLNSSSNGNGLGGGSYTASGSGLSTSGYAPISQLAANTFETFCLEYSEFFTSGTPYNFSMSNAATLGGGGAVAGQDPLSFGTAWLYSQFAQGSLAGYNYGGGRQASNNDLQLAIWFFEDETASISGYGSYGTGSGNSFLNAAVAQFGSVAGAKANANGSFGVSVLNITGVNGTHKQSQLYVSVPDSGATVVLLGLALAGLVGMKRRFARAA